MWTPSLLSKNPTAAAAPAVEGEAPYYENAMMTSSFEGGAATKMHSFEWGATKMPSFEGGEKQQSANDGGQRRQRQCRMCSQQRGIRSGSAEWCQRFMAEGEVG